MESVIGARRSSEGLAILAMKCCVGKMVRANLQPHIMCGGGNVNKYVLLPGDPGRIPRICEHLENAEEIARNRGFLTWNGKYRGVSLTVTSTGIGGPSLAIAIHELCNLGARVFIRVGSCGGLSEKVKIGDLVLPNGAVRDEGTSRAYVDTGYPAIPDFELIQALANAAKKLDYPFHVGINRSHDSFYIPNILAVENEWKKRNVISEDLETATLFTISGLIGVKAASVLNAVVTYGQKPEAGISEYALGNPRCKTGEKASIQVALAAIEMMTRQKIMTKRMGKR
jgi:uridine phosphorylase